MKVTNLKGKITISPSLFMYQNIKLMITKFYNRIKSVKTSFLAGMVLIAVGLILGGLTVLLDTHGEQTSAAKASPSQAFKVNKAVNNPTTPDISGVPVRLSVPSVGVDLKVIPGYYNRSKNSWTLSLNDAQYGTMTAPANNKQGLTFIYAHYRKGVFLTLPKVQPGATAIVKTDNGHTFTYTFRQSVVTKPTDTSLFSYQGKPILVLQTCSGAWYQNRQLFTFDLTKVE